MRSQKYLSASVIKCDTFVTTEDEIPVPPFPALYMRRSYEGGGQTVAASQQAHIHFLFSLIHQTASGLLSEQAKIKLLRDLINFDVLVLVSTSLDPECCKP